MIISRLFPQLIVYLYEREFFQLSMQMHITENNHYLASQRLSINSLSGNKKLVIFTEYKMSDMH